MCYNHGSSDNRMVIVKFVAVYLECALVTIKGAEGSSRVVRPFHSWLLNRQRSTSQCGYRPRCCGIHLMMERIPSSFTRQIYGRGVSDQTNQENGQRDSMFGG
ncbi:hypothetical protein VTO42DRAFT_3826 [Malbranchea cinnamomea]